jgi:16S rRNA A1518/A1519 N6-dimethyltransferase RsmA/KsgA/DIM1 with predicted DNA glycosylase/AP lyase activity
MENDARRYKMQEQAPRFERMADRHTNGTAPRAITAFQLFQTPPTLAHRLAALLPQSQGMRILEPSAGLGRLIDAVHNFEPSELVAVEMAAECARELFTQERAGVRLIQRDFLTIAPEELGAFDAVIMNPPFHMRSDIRHVLHALKFIRPGGTLAALAMDTSHREKALRHLAATWEKIPTGAFSSEGTSVPTVMLSITV